MRIPNGRLMVAAGVVLTIAGILAFGLAAAGTTAGQETDVSRDAQTVQLAADDTSPVLGERVEVSVTVVDDAGEPVAGAECTFSIASQPGSDAAVEDGPVTTDGQGIARTTVDVGTTDGRIQVRAQCGDASATVSLVVGAAQPVGERSASPPASLPDTGTGGYLERDGSTGLLPMGMLAALGVTLAGAGLIAARRGVRGRGQ